MKGINSMIFCGLCTLANMSISAQKRTKPFKIFNASAGSGKTYHLVKEYIELLIGDEKRPDAFSGIIAMTLSLIHI